MRQRSRSIQTVWKNESEDTRAPIIKKRIEIPKVKNADLVKNTVIFFMRFDPEGPNIKPAQPKPRHPTRPLASREQHFGGYATVRVAPSQRGAMVVLICNPHANIHRAATVKVANINRRFMGAAR